MPVILTDRNLKAAMEGQRLRDVGPPDAGPPPKVTVQRDDALARILKMVPGEAAVAYTAALAIDPTSKYLPIAAFVLCAVLVPILVRRDGSKQIPPVSPEVGQYGFQMLAFATWAFSIGNPIAGLGVDIPRWIPALLTIFVPVFGGLLVGRPQPAAPT